jgi:hypothetical protein
MDGDEIRRRWAVAGDAPDPRVRGAGLPGRLTGTEPATVTGAAIVGARVAAEIVTGAARRTA